MMEPRYITVNRASQLTRVSPAHLRRLLASGRIRRHKYRRDWLVDFESLGGFAQNRPKRGRKSAHNPLDKWER